jgi:hypothetical protein
VISAHFDLLPEVEESYQQFIVASGAANYAETVQVKVDESAIVPCGGRILFDSGASWALNADGAERVWVFKLPHLEEPRYSARFLPGAREVAIVCSARLLTGEGDRRCCPSPFRYPLDQVLAMYFLGNSGIILHAAGIAHGGGAVAFAGVSGAGKSTISRLAGVREGFAPVSDDRVILRVVDGKVVLHGTPWPGEARIAENRCADLRWLFFLEQGAINEIRRLTPRESLPRLFKTASLPWYDRLYLDAGLEACGKILQSVPAAVLTFRPETAAVDLLERFLATGG